MTNNADTARLLLAALNIAEANLRRAEAEVEIARADWQDANDAALARIARDAADADPFARLARLLEEGETAPEEAAALRKAEAALEEARAAYGKAWRDYYDR